MAFSIILYNSATSYTFAITPDFMPSYKLEYSEQYNPAAVSKRITRWSIQKAYLINPVTATMIDDFQALKNLVTNSSDPLNKAEFKRDTTVEETLLLAAGSDLKLESLEPVEEPGIWNKHTTWNIVLEQVEDILGASGGSQTDFKSSWSYDEDCLLTYSVSGTVRTSSASAEALAWTKKPALINGFQFHWTTTEVSTNQPDSEASFTFTQKQIGVRLIKPSSFLNQFNKVETESETEDEVRFTTEYVATDCDDGFDAKNALKALKPPGTTEADYTHDHGARSFRARFTHTDTSDNEPKYKVTRSISINNGGRSRVYVPVMTVQSVLNDGPGAGLKVWEGVPEPVRVTETISIQVTNLAPSFTVPVAVLKLPPLIDPAAWSKAESSSQAPVATEKDINGAAVAWELGATRVYLYAKPPSEASLKRAINDTIGVVPLLGAPWDYKK